MLPSSRAASASRSSCTPCIIPDDRSKRQHDNGRAQPEASGRITPQTAPEIAATGVDLISIGWLTHSVPVFDIGLDGCD
ncbi:MAG TPA: hypothetical protein VNE18_02845 [Rhodanobacter sp.]|nr:hypothetical protein [Rhodanobacter sp.]